MRVLRSTQLPELRRSATGPGERTAHRPSKVWTFAHPGVMITPAARFFRLDAPFVSWTPRTRLTDRCAAGRPNHRISIFRPLQAGSSAGIGAPSPSDHPCSPVTLGHASSRTCDVHRCALPSVQLLYFAAAGGRRRGQPLLLAILQVPRVLSGIVSSSASSSTAGERPALCPASQLIPLPALSYPSGSVLIPRSA